MPARASTAFAKDRIRLIAHDVTKPLAVRLPIVCNRSREHFTGRALRMNDPRFVDDAADLDTTPKEPRPWVADVLSRLAWLLVVVAGSHGVRPFRVRICLHCKPSLTPYERLVYTGKRISSDFLKFVLLDSDNCCLVLRLRLKKICPLLVNTMKKKQTTSAHKYKMVAVRLPDTMRQILEQMAQRNVTTLTAEVIRCVREDLERKNLWPPPASQPPSV